MTMRSRTIRGAFAGLAALAALASSGGAGLAAGKNILWVQPMRDHPVHRLMQAGFLAKCAELGNTCEVVGNPSATNYDVSGSIPLAEAAMARTKFDAISVYGPGPEIYPFIGKLGQEGFPVVTWHVLPAEGSVPGLKAATGEDIPSAGKAAAEAMGEKLGGKGVIALTQGSSNDTENVMSEWFRKTMAEKYPDIKVLDTQMEGFEPSAAEAKSGSRCCRAIPTSTPPSRRPATASRPGRAPRARPAARASSSSAWTISAENLDIVKAGGAWGVVAQPLYEESAKTAELANDLAEGKTVPYLNPLPAAVLTAADLEPFYKMLDSAGQ